MELREVRGPRTSRRHSRGGLAAAVPALTADQMREVDRLAVERYGIQLIQMMELAGLALATLARQQVGRNAARRRVAVLAGRGNNGGGGLVAARHLANWGAQVAVFVESAAALRGAPARQWARLTAGAATGPASAAGRCEGEAALSRLLSGTWDLVIDAVIGYGLRGAPAGWAARAVAQMNAAAAPVLSLDAPSGLDVTTGRPYDPCVRADVTMTLALPKTGLLVPPARPFVGTLYLADIGIPPDLYRHLGLAVGPIFARQTLIRLRSAGP